MERSPGWLPVLAVWLLLLQPCHGAMWPFLEPSLSFPERVDDLVSRLTIEEVMEQVGRGGNGFYGSPAPPVERLLIGPYSWNTECLHGDMNNNGTGYPQAIGLAASFSPELVFAVAQGIGEEVRGLYNHFQAAHQYGDHKGLSCFSPVINIMRDPRWGRNQETYGEDPILSGNLATQFVYGLQGNHPRYVRASAGCKHFDVHGGPENIPVDRHTFNANVTERDWRETFLPAFRKCVTAGSYSLMCSFNEINGVPACGNKQLLTDILRGEWDFTGYVVTDGSALTRMVTQHHYVSSPLEAAVLAATAGVNLENSNNESYPVYFHLIDAIKAGKITEEAVRNLAKPLFYTRMRLGEFDPPEMNPYTNLTLRDVRTAQHRNLAMRAAMESFVLLKNDKRALPLKRLYDTMAIVGPMSDDRVQIYGDYAVSQPRNTSTPLVGLSPMATTVQHEKGCFDTACGYYYPPDIQKAVADVDVVIACLGTGQALESENNDRKDLSLPGKQLQLLQDVVKYANGTPVVLLVFSGGPLDISWAVDSEGVQAILQCHFPGETTGDALLRVLTMTGAESPPAGRLPYTWQRSLDQVPPMVDYSMEGRTYRYWKGPGDPLFPFGYGLSYTTFNHSRLNCFWNNYDPDSEPASLSCFWDLAAMDNIVADEVWQLYVSWPNPVAPYLPKLKLVDFGRVRVNGTKRAFITTTVYKEDLVVWIDNQGWTLPSGDLKVYAGGEQPGQSRTTGSIMASTTVTIPNTFLYDPKKRGARAWRKLDIDERVKGH